jgi:hypothetical protein
MKATDSRMYSPNRDLAYCGPDLGKHAILRLDPDKREPRIAVYLEDHNIGEEVIVEAAEVMASYLTNTMFDPANKTPAEALEASGFFALPNEVQTLICAQFGQVLLCSLFTAVRDVTRDANDPPMDFKPVADALDEIRKKLTEKLLHDIFGDQ